MAEKPVLHLEELNLQYEGENPRNTPTAHESLEAGWFSSAPQAGAGWAASRSTPTRTTRGTGEPRRAVRLDPGRLSLYSTRVLSSGWQNPRLAQAEGVVQGVGRSDRVDADDAGASQHQFRRRQVHGVPNGAGAGLALDQLGDSQAPAGGGEGALPLPGRRARPQQPRSVYRT